MQHRIMQPWQMVALAGAVLAACGAESAASKYEFPATSGATVYVAANATEAADGSKDKPYKTISEAAAKAKSGTTIAVAPGTYAESVAVTGGVNLIGAGSDKVKIEPPKDAMGIALTGSGSSKVQGLSVTGATLLGIGSQGVGLDMKDVAVADTKGSATLYGHGVQVTDAESVTAANCKITGNSGVGVYLASVGKVSIIDPSFSPSPAGTEGSTSIIDPSFMPKSDISGNKQGGVAIIDPSFTPKEGGAPTETGATISATNIAGNGMFGVAISGGPLKLVRTAVHGTKKLDSGTSDVADGVVVFETAKKKPAVVEVDAQSVVGGNLRAGVVVASGGEVAIAGQVRDNAKGGLWAAGEGTSVRLVQTARLTRNAMVGVGLAKGAKLDAIGARIEGTLEYPQPKISGGEQVLGDGIGLFTGAHAKLQGVQVRDTARAAILVNDGGMDANGHLDLSVSDTTISGAKYGLAINAGKDFKAKFTDGGFKAGVKLEKVDKEIDPAAKLGVQTNVCDAADGSNAACVQVAKRKE